MSFINRLKHMLGSSSEERRDRSEAPDGIAPHIFPKGKHALNRKKISSAAIKVMQGLHRAGFEGLLVGGGVRDLLLGDSPKDFDIATNATPEQVKNAFRGARIIGRRFKIVHVRFGREIIEVTTFRAQHEAKETKGRKPTNQHSASGKGGMLLRDNVFGTIEDDAIRRDLTINALYFCSKDDTVYDYTNGIADLNDRLIRIIGDPETRYREDPVRMLRVVRFAAKLNFTIETATAEPIKTLAHSLANISAARMFDEVLKLFMGGYSVATFDLMMEYDLFTPLFPDLAHSFKNDDGYGEGLIRQALINTDLRISQGKHVTPAFIYAALLWPSVRNRQQQLMSERVPETPALHQPSQEIISRQQQHTAIPRRFSMPMREIWDLQLKLPKRGGNRAERTLENPRFRAAYDFLLLREQAGENTNELGQWWTDYQERSPDQREAMTQALPKNSPRKRPRKRTKKS